MLVSPYEDALHRAPLNESSEAVAGYATDVMSHVIATLMAPSGPES